MSTTGESAHDLVRSPDRTVRTFLPVLDWLPRYRIARDLPADLVAGIAVAALLIPESMGYAGIAGVPPEVGLYAAIAAIAAYAITGGTSILVVGPASAVAALSASIVGELSGGGEDPVVLTTALALTSGLLLVTAGVLRLGWVVNFISRPVLHAFVAGLSISIIVGQLDSLLGMEFERDSAVGRALEVVTGVADWDPATVAVGVTGVALLLVIERWAPRVPAALVIVVAGILLAWALGPDRGIEVLGDLPQGLPSPGFPDLEVTRWLELIGGGAALLLVGFSEGFAAASSVADRRGETVDGDQELVGAGSANLAAGLLGGMAVSGSLTKSAAGMAAGSRSQVANLVAGLLVVASLLFLAPVFELLPEAVVSAVVIAAVVRAADPRRVLRLWPVNRLDFAAGLATFSLVLVRETLPAMIVGVTLSLAFLVRRASFCDVVEIRLDPNGLYRRVEEETPPPTEPQTVAVIRFEGSLVYANAQRLSRAVTTLLEDRPGVTVVVLDAEMVADLDTDGADTLVDLDDRLRERGVELRIARLHRRAAAQIERSGLAARFVGRQHSHVADATR